MGMLIALAHRTCNEDLINLRIAIYNVKSVINMKKMVHVLWEEYKGMSGY